MTMKLKDASVDVDGLSPLMYFALGVADQAYADEGQECIVTSALDGHHNPGSLHPKGLAVDIRNHDLSADQKTHVEAKLERLERYGFDVVDEGAHATVATTAGHFHIEYDPKGREFWKQDG